MIPSLLQRPVRRLVRRFPFVKKLGYVSEAIVRVALLPMGLSRATVDPAKERELEARTDAYNEASEAYFHRYEDREFILGKPFTEPVHFPRRLFDMGVLFHWLRIRPGDVVLELGAGTCWLSWFLNRWGCRTIAVDVSPTALAMGEEVFRRDPHTRWDLEPAFLPYDGRRLPLEDGSCDAVVINDAFHHVPNQREVLRELARVLVPDGVVAMNEPGRRHSSTPDSVREMEETGVLENDIVVEHLADVARACGFAEAAVVPLSLDGTIPVPAQQLGAFLRGRKFFKYWIKLAGYLEAQHYIFLFKEGLAPNTSRPGALDAFIRTRPRGSVQVAPGAPATVELRIRNLGDTRWLASEARRPGWTRLGARLFTAEGRPIDLDWLRIGLPADVPPGGRLRLPVELPALAEPGRYTVRFDFVIEGLTWFVERGSHDAAVELVVGPTG